MSKVACHTLAGKEVLLHAPCELSQSPEKVGTARDLKHYLLSMDSGRGGAERYLKLSHLA